MYCLHGVPGVGRRVSRCSPITYGDGTVRVVGNARQTEDETEKQGHEGDTGVGKRKGERTSVPKLDAGEDR